MKCFIDKNDDSFVPLLTAGPESGDGAGGVQRGRACAGQAVAAAEQDAVGE